MEGARSSGFRSAWGHADFRRLLSGLVVSGTGDWFYNVALLVYLLDRTGSPGWVAAVSAAKLLPFLLLSAIGGALADRMDRRRVMIASDLLRAAAMGALALTVALDGPLLLVTAIVMASSAAGTPYYPAVGALTPALVPEDDLAAANALTGVVDNLTITLGPALGSILLVLGSPELAIGLNAFTFLLSAFFVLRIATPTPPDAEAEAETLRARLAAGLSAVRGSPDLVLLAVVSLGFTVTFGMEVVLFPLIAQDLLDLGADGVGWLLGASGLGGVLGTWVSGRLAARPRTAGILVATAFLTSLPLLLLTVITNPAVAFAVLLGEGVGFVVGDVISTTTIQRVASREVLGRLFGLLATLFVAGILVGSLLAGFAVDAWGLETAMAIGSGVLIASALAGLPKARRLDRETAARTDATADTVALLQRIRIFDGASRAALESLASDATETSVASGAVVVREGDPADAFYVVRTGTLVVSPVGRVLGPDDHFGEIGVLEGIPRTATVAATTDCALLRIEPDAFVAALNQAPTGMRRLADTLAGRLARTHPAVSPRFTGDPSD